MPHATSSIDKPTLLARLFRHIDGVAEIGCLLVMAATFGAWCSDYHWGLELFTHFRMQYTLCLGAAALWWMGRQRFVFMVISVILACVHATYWIPLYKNPSPHQHTNSSMLRMMAFNILASNQQVDEVRDLIAHEQPDVLLLEEVSRAWMHELSSITNQFTHHLAVPREDNFGIALFSKVPFASATTTNLGRATVPTVDAVLDLDGHTLRFLGLHTLPPACKEYASMRDGQLDACSEIVCAETGLVVIAGDFNATPWAPCLRKLRKQTGLLDSMQGYGPQPTWPTPLLWPFRIPLDHLYHSSKIVVMDRRCGPGAGSDHTSVIVDLRLPFGGSNKL